MSAGVPICWIAPACINATRWQRSASSRYGVATRIVSPSAARCANASQNSRRDTGSTPVVGSSSSSTRGSGTSAQARASFCFIPPLRPSGQPLGEPVHVEHLQVSIAAAFDLGAWNPAKITEVVQVLPDGEIGVEAERLRQISGVRARVAGRLAEDLGHTRRGFHDAGENLEGRGLAGTVRTDQPEDLALRNGERDLAHRFEIAVLLRQVGDTDRRA